MGQSRRRSRRRVWQTVCFFLLLALMIAILLTEIYRGTGSIERETVKRVSYTDTGRYVGYVFRDERVVKAGNGGVLEYQVREGATVASDQLLLKAYRNDLGGTVQRDRAAEIYEEIERLELALAQEVLWSETYFDAYAEMMAELTAGRWQTGGTASEELAASLEKLSTSDPEGEAAERIRVRIATLRAEVEELIRNVKSDPAEAYAAQGGVFTKQTDGYEEAFDLACVATLTPEILNSKLNTAVAAADRAGKVVDSGAFYLVIPTTPYEAMVYTEHTTYAVSLTGGGDCEMLLERIVPSDDGKEMLLVLRAEKMPEGMDLSRRQTVIVQRKTVQGLCIPYSALYTEQDENGKRIYFAYVAKSGKAEKRLIEQVLYDRGGCCIVAPSEKEQYLAEGEQVLISSRTLYEGRGLI